MTTANSDAIPRRRARATRSPAPEAKPRLPLRLLAVVDGSERTNRVVDALIALAERQEAIEVVILNVQQKSGDDRLRGYQSFKQDEVDARLVEDFGGPIIESVGQRLDKVGIHHTAKVTIGDPARIILDEVTKERCDAVVIGDAAHPWQRWLAGTVGLSIGTSLASRIAALAPVPVIVAK
jgi:nucleotide-binding universal stress UspA family protein